MRTLWPEHFVMLGCTGALPGGDLHWGHHPRVFGGWTLHQQQQPHGLGACWTGRMWGPARLHWVRIRTVG